MLGVPQHGRVNESAESEPSSVLETLKADPAWAWHSTGDLYRIQPNRRGDKPKVAPDNLAGNRSNGYGTRYVANSANQNVVAAGREAHEHVATLTVRESPPATYLDKNLGARDPLRSGIVLNDTT